MSQSGLTDEASTDELTYALTLELPEKIFVPLLHAAKSANQSPEEWLVENLDKQLNTDGVDLRRHFGAVDRSIDADLARAYDSTNP